MHAAVTIIANALTDFTTWIIFSKLCLHLLKKSVYLQPVFMVGVGPHFSRCDATADSSQNAHCNLQHTKYVPRNSRFESNVFIVVANEV